MDLSRLHITNTKDKTGLIDSTQKSKQEILNSLGIKKHSGLFDNFKNYIINIINTEQ